MERWLGKVALVTGASSGYGASIVAELVRRGLNVVGVARRVERIQDLAKELKNEKGKLHPLKVDITKENEVVDAFRWTTETLGPAQILVNNAGVLHYEPIAECRLDRIRAMFEVNVFGPAICTREYLKWASQKKLEGHIININSIVGAKMIHIKGVYPYTAAKHAAKCMTEGTRYELLKDKMPIKVTNIFPGCGTTELFGEQEIKVLSTIIEDPTAFLKPEDMADTVVYALSTDPRVRVSEIIVQHAAENLM